MAVRAYKAFPDGDYVKVHESITCEQQTLWDLVCPLDISSGTCRGFYRSTQGHIYRAEDPDGASSSSSLIGDDSVTGPLGHDDMSNDSLMTEEPLRECEGDIPKIIAEEIIVLL